MYQLRPYQASAIRQIDDCFEQGINRVVLYLPTAGGKTITAAGLIDAYISKGLKVGFICNRIQLIQQTYERFNDVGIQGMGVIQGVNSFNEDAQLVIASIQTMGRRGFPKRDLWVVDECHFTAASKQFHALLKEQAGVPIVGLSATPFSKGLGKIFETVVVGSTIPRLIDQGFLCDLDVYAPDTPDLKGVRIVAGDYEESSLGQAMDKPKLIGGIVEHWLKLGNGKQTVVFGVNVGHSQHICAEFNKAGIKAAHIDGYMNDAQRKKILKEFDAGKHTVLCNCSLLSEGWDSPPTEVMILARPTRSLTRFIQMVGRVLRISPNKERALMLDHSGSTLRLGFPTDELPLELDDGKPKKEAKKREGEAKEEALPKLCPVCKFLKKPKVHKCPACGFEPVAIKRVETGAGDLKLLKRNGAKPIQTFKDFCVAHVNDPEIKQNVYSQLRFVSKDRGYADGWAANQYKNLFGVWPRKLHGVPMNPSTEIMRHLKAEAIRYRYSAKSGSLNATTKAAPPQNPLRQIADSKGEWDFLF